MVEKMRIQTAWWDTAVLEWFVGFPIQCKSDNSAV